jgi:mitogen-activated protein kinase kinase
LDGKKKKKDKGVSLGGGGHTMSILELLHHIVNEPAPRLVSRSRKFPDSATTFIESCLNKEPNDRQSPQELLVSDFMTGCGQELMRI